LNCFGGGFVFYRVKVKDHVRVPPQDFGKPLEEGILEELRKKYSGFIDKNLGIVISPLNIESVGEGVLIPGDGAAYHEAVFSMLVFKPELQEVVPGFVTDITDFGAFIGLGPIDGMTHISQTMPDFVSYSKDKVLQGKTTKRSLKVGDLVKAKIVAVSFKDPANPKIGLTMRQPFLGKEEWIAEDLANPKQAQAKQSKGKAK